MPVVAPALPAPAIEITRIDVLQSLADASLSAGAASPDMSVSPAGACDLTTQVQDALRHDDAILRQLPAIPVESRSVANAIVVWNAGWIDPGTGPARAALTMIRHTIEQSVAASSADCRSQTQSGPRLVYLPGASGKVLVLALGSGQWAWQQLSADPAAQTDGAVAPVALPPPPLMTLQTLAPAARPRPAAVDPAPAMTALLASLIGRRSATSTPYTP